LIFLMATGEDLGEERPTGKLRLSWLHARTAKRGVSSIVAGNLVAPYE
jgi:hypothetical protein